MSSMRTLLVRHRAEFRYASPARGRVNEVRLAPVNGFRQRVERSRLLVEPAAETAESLDAFGNKVSRFSLPDEHERLVVESESVVTTVGVMPARPRLRPEQQWRAVEAPSYRSAWAVFLRPSELVKWTSETRRLAEELMAPHRGEIAQWAADLARVLGERFHPEPAGMDGSTPLDGVIRAGRGGPRDLAHLLTGLCRMTGVAARFVSGWLSDAARDGSGTSHAWAEVQVPDFGWVEIDPAHPGEVDERYLRVAVGRDYADVVPIRGTHLGGVKGEASVEVEVREPGDTAAREAARSVF